MIIIIKSISQNTKKLIWPGILFSSLLFVGLIIFSGCTEKPHARININMLNADRAMVYLIELGNAKDNKIDSVKLSRAGKAKFKVPLKEHSFYQVKFANNQSLTFILSPDEEINLKADYNDIYKSKVIEGSENTSKVNMLHDSLRSTISKMEKLKSEYSKISEVAGDTSQLHQLSERYEKLINAHKRFSIGFILNDLKSLANIAALFQEYSYGYFVFSEGRDMQFYKLVSDTLSKYYPNVKYVKLLSSNYKLMFENYQTQRLLKLTNSTENTLPDIKLPGKNGSTVKLSSLKGKIVLLSFWSVLNKDCIALNRDMINIYKKFRGNNFEIYQVSIDNSKDDWLRTIKYEEIPWISVCDTSFPQSNILWAYNINALPLNYLINKDQNEILGKNMTPSTLERQLSQLLKTN